MDLSTKKGGFSRCKKVDLPKKKKKEEDFLQHPSFEHSIIQTWGDIFAILLNGRQARSLKQLALTHYFDFRT